MIEKHRENREQIEIFSVEEFVSANHLLQIIYSALHPLIWIKHNMHLFTEQTSILNFKMSDNAFAFTRN